MGSFYAWSNNQEGGTRIFSKLDRVFANEAWLDSFPLVTTVSQWEVISDHCFVLLKHLPALRMAVKPFRFYNMWVSNPKFRETVLANWLCTEDREAFLEFKRQEQMYASFLYQKSKIAWLHFGDDNSSFFHASLKKRKLTNRIVSYVTDEGRVEDDYTEVTNHFFQHFKNFLGAASKASGKIYSQVIACGLVLVCIPQNVNKTLISLIPKVDHPVNAADFRPIACCSTIYKCISKMLCSRLNSVLPLLINQNQGAFIKHRSLAHNVLILQDLIKGYNRKNSSPRCLMKIDISKVYDSIDWDFLENLLNALCFSMRFIRWVMVFCRDSSYSLVMNGSIQGHFQGAKGLRQGYPISPLLFVIVMDYLTHLLLKPSTEKDFRFHPLCKSLKLVNLCFANDLLLFCKANPKKFFWGEKGNKSKFLLISWEHVFRSKCYGGLGFREGPTWNKILLAKFIWAISSKKDLLWVKWVNCIYLKGTSLWDYLLKQDTSWYWRKLINLCQSLSRSELDGAVVNGKLQLGKLYSLVLPNKLVFYEKAVWCRLTVPKHRFILWLAVNQKLLPRDLLHQCHLPIPSLLCPACSQEDESHSHLFFDSLFSRRVMQTVYGWLGEAIWPVQYADWSQWLTGHRNGWISLVVAATLAATVYFIWLNRNHCCFEKSCFYVSRIDNLIRFSVKARVQNLNDQNFSIRERQMLDIVINL
ncbi:uncharacterized protein LOC133779430 [Humulus lupulus]|uniref:uncharacterized protein LOC133779430 n=1 Tax=Humulus lupulus TaxID=3486 RepID=UPI002B415029|nr:uncharacterized protein LOC133779430 [Humulus lupulus]